MSNLPPTPRACESGGKRCLWTISTPAVQAESGFNVKPGWPEASARQSPVFGLTSSGSIAPAEPRQDQCRGVHRVPQNPADGTQTLRLPRNYPLDHVPGHVALYGAPPLIIGHRHRRESLHSGPDDRPYMPHSSILSSLFLLQCPGMYYNRCSYTGHVRHSWALVGD